MGSTVIVSADAEVEMKNAVVDVIASQTYSRLPGDLQDDEVFREQLDVLRLLDLWNIDELDQERFRALDAASQSAFREYSEGEDRNEEVVEKWSAILEFMQSDDRASE